jgi:hypothetical protein
MQFSDDEPSERFRIERDQLVSVERTGKTRQGGQIEFRLTFADGSFADWALHPSLASGFWEAAEAFPPAAA